LLIKEAEIFCYKKRPGNPKVGETTSGFPGLLLGAE